MPEAAPVTTATRPLNRLTLSSLATVCSFQWGLFGPRHQDTRKLIV
jgi:hypothetical protein